LLRSSGASEIVVKGGQAIDPQSKVNAGETEIHSLDQQLDNAGLLSGERAKPEPG
jgi:hypothetical protein